MGEGRSDWRGFPSQEPIRDPVGSEKKSLLDAGNKSQAATITSHLPFKEEYPHVRVLSSCQVGQGEGAAEESTNTARMFLARCLEPIRLANTLYWALLPSLHHHGIFWNWGSSSAHPGLHFSLPTSFSFSPMLHTFFPFVISLPILVSFCFCLLSLASPWPAATMVSPSWAHKMLSFCQSHPVWSYHLHLKMVHLSLSDILNGSASEAITVFSSRERAMLN